MPANPIRNPAEWHTFRIAGVTLPGIAKVSGCVDARKIDVKGAKGASGAVVSDEGALPKPFKLELVFTTEEECDEWDNGEGRRILKDAPIGSTSKAPGVDHPACQECDITAVLRGQISQKEPLGDGAWKVTIELYPWTPKPKPSGGTPGGSSTAIDGPGGTKNAKDRADELQEELGAALEEAGA
jgi:hypothetical protein